MNRHPSASPTPATPSPRPHPTVATVALPPQSPTATWQLGGLTFTTGRRTTAALHVGKTISGRDSDRLRQAALVFARPTLKPSCLAAATLDLTVTGGRNLNEAELGVYPSDESNYLDFARVANTTLDLGRLVDNRPRGYVFEVTTGRLHIDITALYRTWTAGGPLPSLGATVNRSWPFGVIIRPPAADNGDYDVVIANDRAPQLRLSRLASCASSAA